MNKNLCIIAAALGFSMGAGSQNIQPVVINSDHSVTISVKFPDAEEVSIREAFCRVCAHSVRRRGSSARMVRRR